MRTQVETVKKKCARCPKKIRQDTNYENHSLYERTCTVNTGSLSRWSSQVRLFLRDGKHVLNAK